VTLEQGVHWRKGLTGGEGSLEEVGYWRQELFEEWAIGGIQYTNGGRTY
jgi:hypothetical protein